MRFRYDNKMFLMTYYERFPGETIDILNKELIGHIIHFAQDISSDQNMFTHHCEILRAYMFSMLSLVYNIFDIQTANDLIFS